MTENPECNEIFFDRRFDDGCPRATEKRADGKTEGEARAAVGREVKQ